MLVAGHDQGQGAVVVSDGQGAGRAGHHAGGADARARVQGEFGIRGLEADTRGEYRLIETYSICKWSGDLGPKIKEGDYQSPEGFYNVSPGMMNLKSSYYLSFNTGFPNKFDGAYGHTGTNLMVHGNCKSVGCYAMTDEQMNEIYALARESFAGGNASFKLELYPFRMTDENMTRYSSNPNIEFWRNLKQGYDTLGTTKRPPDVDVCGGRYVFDAKSAGMPNNGMDACPVTVASTA